MTKKNCLQGDGIPSSNSYLHDSRDYTVGLPRDVSNQNYGQGNGVGVHLNTYMVSRTRRTASEEQATYCESLKAFTPNTHLSICCSRLMAIPYHIS